MSGQKIIEGANEALAWTRGEGRLRVSRIIDGKVVSEDMSFEEYMQRESAEDEVVTPLLDRRKASG